MKAQCLTGARFNLIADVLRQSGDATDSSDPTDFGHWEDNQDPLTGDIIRVWVPEVSDDPSTPDIDETQYYQIPCVVRGIIEGGVRAAGTTEDWSEIYKNVELARMFFPSNRILTKRDRVLNIRNKKGQVLWKEEELGDSTINDDVVVYKSTVFEVLGVTPVIGPFGEHIENYALLERAEVQ